MSSFSHIAILGRQPEVGLAELEALLGHEGVAPFGRETALLSEAVDVNRLGGSIKIAQIVARVTTPVLDEVISTPEVLEAVRAQAKTGKFVLGLSVYGQSAGATQVRAAGSKLKKILAADIGPVRYISHTASRQALTAAQLKFNQVMKRGCELIVAFDGAAAVAAITVGVQDIDWYGERDYGRPARSAKIGMLPPKLAQVLINTTRGRTTRGRHVVDPFCGTGVVLQEALLLGRTAEGSDLSEEMVAATQTNLEWLSHKVTTKLPAWNVAQADARRVEIPAGAAIVSEGYLGRHLDHSPTPGELDELRTELMELYRAALENFSRQQAAGDEVAICVPAWRVRGAWQYLGIVDEVSGLGYTLKRFKHVRTPLLYARGDQIVGRQLLLLRKN